MKVLIVDDHKALRRAVAMQLRMEPDIELVGEAENGEAAIASARSLQPDVIVMDVQMPIMDGVKATRIIHQEFPGMSIIAFTMFQSQDQSAAMHEAGAMRYMEKGGRADALLKAIRECVMAKREAVAA